MLLYITLSCQFPRRCRCRCRISQLPVGAEDVGHLVQEWYVTGVDVHEHHQCEHVFVTQVSVHRFADKLERPDSIHFLKLQREYHETFEAVHEDENKWIDNHLQHQVPTSQDFIHTILAVTEHQHFVGPGVRDHHVTEEVDNRRGSLREQPHVVSLYHDDVETCHTSQHRWSSTFKLILFISFPWKLAVVQFIAFFITQLQDAVHV